MTSSLPEASSSILSELDHRVEGILASFVTGRLDPSHLPLLARFETVIDEHRDVPARTPNTVATALDKRLSVLAGMWPEFDHWCRSRSVGPRSFLLDTWKFWIPLAEQMSARQSMVRRPFVHAFVAPSGAGKTTAAVVLKGALEQLGHQPIALSLDDFYWPGAKLEKIFRNDPFLRWRGPPGTHDVELAMRTLKRLRQAEHPVDIPRFDKAARNGQGDRVGIERCNAADSILFEGWFLGFPHRPHQYLAEILAGRAARQLEFAGMVNDRLRYYEEIWSLFDSLTLMKIPAQSFFHSWRIDAEQRRLAQGRDALGPAETRRVVDYLLEALPARAHYWPMCQDIQRVDAFIELDEGRRPIALRLPAKSRLRIRADQANPVADPGHEL